MFIVKTNDLKYTCNRIGNKLPLKNVNKLEHFPSVLGTAQCVLLSSVSGLGQQNTLSIERKYPGIFPDQILNNCMIFYRTDKGKQNKDNRKSGN